MSLRVIVPATVEPVTLAEAKYHLRLTTDVDDAAVHEDDRRILGLIPAARQVAENHIGRPIALATYEWRGANFVAVLPVSPLESVERVEYVDSSGSVQTLAPEGWELTGTLDEPRLRPAYGTAWPTGLRPADDAVRVLFVAGYGVAVPLPSPIRQAMLMILGHLFENAETTAAADASGGMLREIPMGATYLLNPYRIGMGV